MSERGAGGKDMGTGPRAALAEPPMGASAGKPCVPLVPLPFRATQPPAEAACGA